jgi:hypothetical protein
MADRWAKHLPAPDGGFHFTARLDGSDLPLIGGSSPMPAVIRRER